MEVAFRRGAFADPGSRNTSVALVCGSHRPADRLRKLCREIASQREHAGFARGVKDRKLPSLQPVKFVRVDLAHHVEQWPITCDQKALLAIGWETHVGAVEGKGSTDRDRLLASAFQIKRGLALPLHFEHALIEGTCQHHGAERPPQRLGIELGVPRSNSSAVVVDHTDQPKGEVASL